MPRPRKACGRPKRRGPARARHGSAPRRLRRAAGRPARLAAPALALGVAALAAGPAAAHVSERAVVLLLPTGIYRIMGVLAVLATVALTLLLPARPLRRLLGEGRAPLEIAPPSAGAGSALSFALLFGLIGLGLWGPHNPLGNLLPLTLFHLWWVCLLLLAALAGNFWRHLNPWAAPARWLLRGWVAARPMAPQGPIWPAIGAYALFALYALSDLAPDDPPHLARMALGYWLAHFALIALFGPGWLSRGEAFTVLFDLAGRLSPLVWRGWRPVALRFPGAALLPRQAVPVSFGAFALTLLAIGSFDGLNETFWWMGLIGINPLEFPGRSAVIWQNRAGLIGAIIGLNLLFALCIRLGLALAGAPQRMGEAFGRGALATLPIALAYHFAHYLTAVLVGLQYWLAALNDPLESGARLLAPLGLAPGHVTTSFFNQYHTVRLIWLSQAGAIVLGHMLAVILAHGAALRLFQSHRKALISQAPVALFMIGYTWFGLWLLASPTAL